MKQNFMSRILDFYWNLKYHWEVNVLIVNVGDLFFKCYLKVFEPPIFFFFFNNELKGKPL